MGHDNAQLTQSTIPLPSLVSPAILSHSKKMWLRFTRLLAILLKANDPQKTGLLRSVIECSHLKKLILTWMVDSIENLMGWLCYERQINKGKIQSSNTNKIDAEQVFLQI